MHIRRIAVFVLVAFALSLLYIHFLLGVVMPVLHSMKLGDRQLIATALFLSSAVPTLALLAVSMITNVWRKERAIVDAIILTAICIPLPQLAGRVYVWGACALLRYCL